MCPAITIHFLPDGYELAVFLPSSDKGWSRKTYHVAKAEWIADVINQWCNDPEYTAKTYFGWAEPSSTPPPKAKSEITLEMLGL